MIRVLIVDDEPIIRRGLRNQLANRDNYEVIGECCNGRSAIEKIDEWKPDLVFLDVQMPEVDGFGVIREIGAENMPAVVFITAYDEYAVRAFDVNALDYLLKPFDEDRLQRCLLRVEQRLAEPRAGSALVQQLASLVAGQGKPRTARHPQLRPDHPSTNRRDRLDRSRGQLCRDPRRQASPPDARDFEQFRAAATAAPLPAHPPLAPGKRGSNQRNAPALPWRVRARATRRHTPHIEPSLPRGAPEPAGVSLPFRLASVVL